jgi:uncharacterized protein
MAERSPKPTERGPGTAAATVVEVETPHGRARVHLHTAERPAGALVLGHGAGGGVNAPDLVAATAAARSAGFAVALVEQPYLVAGRRSQAPAGQLDAAWIVVARHLRENELGGLPLVAGGRSAGARVACRTAADTAAVAVLCLAFPVHPPGRADDPEKSRQFELDAVDVPVLVVQGDSDPFGMPKPGGRRTIVMVPGNHSLRKSLDEVTQAVRGWLPQVVR